MYWENPRTRETRPPYCEACLETVFRNADCTIRVCDRTSATRWIDLPKQFGDLTPMHQSDVFRLAVLAEYGGMYLDFDTVVVRSLRPLFDLLAEVELVGADWRPRRLRPDLWEPLGVGAMGPMRPNLPFMLAAREAQLEVLRAYEARLAQTPYPFKNDALLARLVTPSFFANPPRARLRNGADSWFAFVGGPDWDGGDQGSPTRRAAQDATIPPSELFTFTNSILPKTLLAMPVSEVLSSGTVLGMLLRRALTTTDAVEGKRPPGDETYRTLTAEMLAGYRL